MAHVLRNWLIGIVLVLGTSMPVMAEVSEDIGEPAADVSIWGVHIITLRATFRDFSPAERAEIVIQRIHDIPLASEYDVSQVRSTEGEYIGVWVIVNRHRVFGFLEDDVPEGIGIEQFGDIVIGRLRVWLDRRQAQQQPQVLWTGLAYSAIATLVFVLAVWITWRGRNGLTQWLAKLNSNQAAQEKIKLGGVNMLPYILNFFTGVFRLLVFTLMALYWYLWLTFVMRQFPYTEGVGERLTDYILSLISKVGGGIVHAIPDLIMVAIIFWLARFVNSIVRNVFDRIESGWLTTRMFDAETAKASRRVIIIMVWIFAGIIAYPYIPGSETEAFKGVSVFLGLMVSLGSAGIISQVLGGLIVVYSRAFQPGDYVKINNYEGIVLVVGVLSTKVKTLRNEEVSVPNAVLLGAATVNYSRLSRTDGLVISTSVTIGYDTPWRQVHDLLLAAAKRCGYARKSPEPRVLQSGLNDWYVAYDLLVCIDSPAQKLLALTELHQFIQDEFAAANVQIMSPHFVDQPDQAVLPGPWEKKVAEAPKS